MYVLKGLSSYMRKGTGTVLCAFVLKECDPVKISLNIEIAVTLTKSLCAWCNAYATCGVTRGAYRDCNKKIKTTLVKTTLTQYQWTPTQVQVPKPADLLRTKETKD